MTSKRNPQVSLFLDENVDRQVLAYLRAEGHDGEHVVDALEPGAADATNIAPYAERVARPKGGQPNGEAGSAWPNGVRPRNGER